MLMFFMGSFARIKWTSFELRHAIGQLTMSILRQCSLHTISTHVSHYVTTLAYYKMINFKIPIVTSWTKFFFILFFFFFSRPCKYLWMTRSIEFFSLKLGKITKRARMFIAVWYKQEGYVGQILLTWVLLS